MTPLTVDVIATVHVNEVVGHSTNCSCQTVDAQTILIQKADRVQTCANILARKAVGTT